MVMTALCPMLGVKAVRIKDPKDSTRKIDSYWEAAKGKEMLGNGRELLKKMIHYDKDDMDPDMVEKVTKQTENPDFNPEFVKKGSVACAGVCSWIQAMMIYDRVAQVVRPKKEALAEAEASLLARVRNWKVRKVAKAMHRRQQGAAAIVLPQHVPSAANARRACRVAVGRSRPRLWRLLEIAT